MKSEFIVPRYTLATDGSGFISGAEYVTEESEERIFSDELQEYVNSEIKKLRELAKKQASDSDRLFLQIYEKMRIHYAYDEQICVKMTLQQMALELLV